MMYDPSQHVRHSRRAGAERSPAARAQLQLEGTAKQSLEAGRTRLLVAALVFTVAFAVVGLRLVGLALWHEGLEPRRAEAPRVSTLQAVRADIVDRNGVVLATTLPSVSLYANPRQLRDPLSAALRLAEVLPGLDPEVLAGKLASDRSFVWLKRKLTPRQQHAVNRLGIPGLYFQQEQERIYPHGALTAHVVGFTNVDNRGLAGVEQAFETELRGGTGPVQLSLDLRVQHIMQRELSAAMERFSGIGAAGLVLDAETGEVISMVSLPEFDPLDPGAAPDDRRFNRASLGVYEMGSVFKIFTTAMALEREVVDLRDGYDVSRPIRAAGYTITDFKPKTGWLSIPEIFIYSSNIGTVQMAMDTGKAAQQLFLRDLGLTRPTEIELPEIGQPIVPSPWRDINAMTVSYGHGLAVSPLQVARAVAAVVNGGELKPATLTRRPEGRPVAGRRVLREDTSRDMRWLMRLAVLHGTGRKADAPGYLVGGKTGTADKLLGRRYSDDLRIASFVGAFPMDRPRYVVFAMVDEPRGLKSTYGYATGGWVAAPVVRRVIEGMAPLTGIRPKPRQEEDTAERRLIPVSFEGPAFASN